LKRLKFEVKAVLEILKDHLLEPKFVSKTQKVEVDWDLQFKNSGSTENTK